MSVLPEEGDIIKFQRGGFAHYGIYVGDGKVIHRTAPQWGLFRSSGVSNSSSGVSSSSSGVSSSSSGVSNSSSGVSNSTGGIREDFIEDVAGDGTKPTIVHFRDKKYKPYPGKEVVRRARSKLGETGYSVLFNNCEHFVTWCRYGEKVSHQAEFALTASAVSVPFLIMALVGGGASKASNPNQQ